MSRAQQFYDARRIREANSSRVLSADEQRRADHTEHLLLIDGWREDVAAEVYAGRMRVEWDEWEKVR